MGGNDKVSTVVKARHYLKGQQPDCGQVLYPVTKFAASSLLRCQQGCATQKKTLARVSRALEASLEVQHQLLVVSAVHRFTSQPLCCAFCILQTRRQNMKLRGRRLKRLTSATCRSQEQGLGIPACFYRRDMPLHP